MVIDLHVRLDHQPHNAAKRVLLFPGCYPFRRTESSAVALELGVPTRWCSLARTLPISRTGLSVSLGTQSPSWRTDRPACPPWNLRDLHSTPQPATCGLELRRNCLGPLCPSRVLLPHGLCQRLVYRSERSTIKAVQCYATTSGTTALVDFRDRSRRPSPSWTSCPSWQELRPHAWARGPRPRRTHGRSGRCYAWRPSHPCSERRCPPRCSP